MSSLSTYGICNMSLHASVDVCTERMIQTNNFIGTELVSVFLKSNVAFFVQIDDFHYRLFVVCNQEGIVQWKIAHSSCTDIYSVPPAEEEASTQYPPVMFIYFM